MDVHQLLARFFGFVFGRFCFDGFGCLVDCFFGEASLQEASQARTLQQSEMNHKFSYVTDIPTKPRASVLCSVPDATKLIQRARHALRDNYNHGTIPRVRNASVTLTRNIFSQGVCPASGPVAEVCGTSALALQFVVSSRFGKPKVSLGVGSKNNTNL
eukprot:5094991-Amphidinium_carterae.1